VTSTSGSGARKRSRAPRGGGSSEKLGEKQCTWSGGFRRWRSCEMRRGAADHGGCGGRAPTAFEAPQRLRGSGTPPLPARTPETALPIDWSARKRKSASLIRTTLSRPRAPRRRAAGAAAAGWGPATRKERAGSAQRARRGRTKRGAQRGRVGGRRHLGEGEDVLAEVADGLDDGVHRLTVAVQIQPHLPVPWRVIRRARPARARPAVGGAGLGGLFAARGRGAHPPAFGGERGGGQPDLVDLDGPLAHPPDAARLAREPPAVAGRGRR